MRPTATRFSLPLAAVALLVAACSAPLEPGLGGAGVAPGVAVVPLADPSLPEPAVESLAPICAPPDPAAVAEMQQSLNAERVRLGKSPLSFRDNLAFAAQAHACDMATMGRLTVAGSNGSSVVNRVRAVEYSACSSAQLIGRAGDAWSQAAAWNGRKADHEIVVHQKFDDAGVGVVQTANGTWWSLVMADSCNWSR